MNKDRQHFLTCKVYSRHLSLKSQIFVEPSMLLVTRDCDLQINDYKSCLMLLLGFSQFSRPVSTLITAPTSFT